MREYLRDIQNCLLCEEYCTGNHIKFQYCNKTYNSENYNCQTFPLPCREFWRLRWFINFFMKQMLPYIENTKTAMTILSDIVVKRLRKSQESETLEEEMAIPDCKKCMDILRDITDSAIKLAKNEQILEDQLDGDCLIMEKKSQEIYTLLQTLKTHFTPKVLTDIIEMGEEKAMKIISQVVEKSTNESESKIKRRDFKTKAEYKRAKFIQKFVVKRSQEEIEQSQREYREWFDKLSGIKPTAEQKNPQIDAETQIAEDTLNEDCMNWNQYQNSFKSVESDDGEIPNFYS